MIHNKIYFIYQGKIISSRVKYHVWEYLLVNQYGMVFEGYFFHLFSVPWPFEGSVPHKKEMKTL